MNRYWQVRANVTNEGVAYPSCTGPLPGPDELIEVMEKVVADDLQRRLNLAIIALELMEVRCARDLYWVSRDALKEVKK